MTDKTYSTTITERSQHYRENGPQFRAMQRREKGRKTIIQISTAGLNYFKE